MLHQDKKTIQARPTPPPAAVDKSPRQRDDDKRKDPTETLRCKLKAFITAAINATLVTNTKDDVEFQRAKRENKEASDDIVSYCGMARTAAQHKLNSELALPANERTEAQNSLNKHQLVDKYINLLRLKPKPGGEEELEDALEEARAALPQHVVQAAEKKADAQKIQKEFKQCNRTKLTRSDEFDNEVIDRLLQELKTLFRNTAAELDKVNSYADLKGASLNMDVGVVMFAPAYMLGVNTSDLPSPNKKLHEEYRHLILNTLGLNAQILPKASLVLDRCVMAILVKMCRKLKLVLDSGVSTTKTSALDVGHLRLLDDLAAEYIPGTGSVTYSETLLISPITTLSQI